MSSNSSSGKDYFRMAGVLSDPLTRKILAKLASPHSAIDTNAIPTEKLHAKKIQIVNRLSRLEKVNLVTSKLIHSDNIHYTKYEVNPNGDAIAKDLLSEELKEFL